MKLVILAVIVGVASAQIYDVEASAKGACPRMLDRDFASMLKKEKVNVVIRQSAPNEVKMHISPWRQFTHEKQPWELISAPMDMKECSASFPNGVPSSNGVPVKIFVGYDAVVVPGGVQKKLILAILDLTQKPLDGVPGYPIDELVMLNGVREGLNPATFVPMPKQPDCSMLGKGNLKKVVVADLGKPGHHYEVELNGHALTVRRAKDMEVRPWAGPMKDWGMTTNFDAKTCTAMLNLAPMSPGYGEVRKLRVGIMHAAGSGTPAMQKMWISFELTDPSGAAAPVNMPIPEDLFPTDRWVGLTPFAQAGNPDEFFAPAITV